MSVFCYWQILWLDLIGFDMCLNALMLLLLLLFTQFVTWRAESMTEECVQFGSSWSVNCSSSLTVDPAFVAWRLNDTLLTDYMYMGALEFESVSQSDSGVYECYNIDNSLVYSANTLTVFQPIRFISPLSYDVSIGQDFQIFCVASGYPELAYSWSMSGVPIGTSSMSLSILNVSVSDIGEYSCLISNECEQIEVVISVSLSQQVSLSGAVIIAIVVGVIIVSFVAIICMFISMVQVSKYVRHLVSGSKSGSRRSTNISFRRNKSFAHSSSHRDSISEMFVKEGVIHSNPVFIEGSTNEKSAFIGNLIGIPQHQSENQKPEIPLVASATEVKQYSIDDLEIKPKPEPEVELTPDVKRSRSLKYSKPQPPPSKLAPYEHRFSPPRYHDNQKQQKKLPETRESSQSVAKQQKLFQAENMITVMKRKISLEDDLSVTPGDISDFLTNEMSGNDSNSDEELVAPLPIRMPRSGATRETQKEDTILKQTQRHNSDLSWDELDKHFHVLDTYVTPGATKRAKRVSTVTTKPSPNLESIVEESNSMVRLSEEVSKVAVKSMPQLVYKVTDIDEVDPWIERDISNIPKEIVATRTKRFDSKYFH